MFLELKIKGINLLVPQKIQKTKSQQTGQRNTNIQLKKFPKFLNFSIFPLEILSQYFYVF